MDLVNIERRAVDGRFRAVSAPLVIAPTIPAKIVELPGCARAGLGVEGVGVGLEHRVAPLRGDGKLIRVVTLQPRDKAFPKAVGVARHRVVVSVPGAEISHDGHIRGVRRPHAEHVAVFSRPPRAVRTEIAVGLAVRAAVKGSSVKSSAGLLHTSCPFSS